MCVYIYIGSKRTKTHKLLRSCGGQVMLRPRPNQVSLSFSAGSGSGSGSGAGLRGLTEGTA